MDAGREAELLATIASQQRTIAEQATAIAALTAAGERLRAEGRERQAEMDALREAQERERREWEEDKTRDMRDLQQEMLAAWGRDHAEQRDECQRLREEAARAAAEGARVETLVAQVADMMAVLRADAALTARRLAAVAQQESARRAALATEEEGERVEVLQRLPAELKQHLFVQSCLVGGRAAPQDGGGEAAAAAVREAVEGYLRLWRAVRVTHADLAWWRATLRHERVVDKVQLQGRGGPRDDGSRPVISADETPGFVRCCLAALPALRVLVLHDSSVGLAEALSLRRPPGPGSFPELQKIALWFTPYTVADLTALLEALPNLNEIDVHVSCCTSWEPFHPRDRIGVTRALRNRVSFW